MKIWLLTFAAFIIAIIAIGYLAVLAILPVAYVILFVQQNRTKESGENHGNR